MIFNETDVSLGSRKLIENRNNRNRECQDQSYQIKLNYECMHKKGDLCFASIVVKISEIVREYVDRRRVNQIIKMIKAFEFCRIGGRSANM